MTFALPAKTTVIITARRLGGTIQTSTPLIGPIDQITYDYQQLGGEGVVIQRLNITPWKRVASPFGEPVDIEAADVGDEATVIHHAAGDRLYVRESIVYDECE